MPKLVEKWADTAGLSMKTNLELRIEAAEKTLSDQSARDKAILELKRIVDFLLAPGEENPATRYMKTCASEALKALRGEK